MMKAIQYLAFGNSGVLRMKQVSKPVPKENEVLIHIAAASVNPMDIKFRTGILQQQRPIFLPYTPGLDAAGTVEATGSQVTRLKVGDLVFATTYGGTYAEYIALPEENVAVMPRNVTVEEAAALANALVTAYTFLIEGAQLRASQRLLIHGAAGGMGGTMVQLAKTIGAYIIGTASGQGLIVAKSLGADEVIDYKTQDFTQLTRDIDVVIDLIGGDTQLKSYRLLRPGGKLLSAAMPPDQALAQHYQVTAQFLVSTPSYKKLEYGSQLVEAGKISPQVAKLLSLTQAAQAQDLVSAGGLPGKVVLTVQPN